VGQSVTMNYFDVAEVPMLLGRGFGSTKVMTEPCLRAPSLADSKNGLPFFSGRLAFFMTSSREFFDGQEDPKDRDTLAIESAAPELNPSMVVINYLFDNPETQTVPFRFAAFEGIK
jgi:hypothetical protein